MALNRVCLAHDRDTGMGWVRLRAWVKICRVKNPRYTFRYAVPPLSDRACISEKADPKNTHGKNLRRYTFIRLNRISDVFFKVHKSQSIYTLSHMKCIRCGTYMRRLRVQCRTLREREYESKNQDIEGRVGGGIVSDRGHDGPSG